MLLVLYPFIADDDDYEETDVGAASKGNSGNVGMSMALMGGAATTAATAEAGEEPEGRFERTKFKQEDDFM